MSSGRNTPSLVVAATKKTDGAKTRRNRRLTNEKQAAKNLALTEEDNDGLVGYVDATGSRTATRRSSPGVSGLPTKSVDPRELEEEEQENMPSHDEHRKVVVGAERVSGPSAVPGHSLGTIEVGGSFRSGGDHNTITQPTVIVAETVDEAAQRNQQAELEELRNQRADVEQMRKFYSQIPSAQAEALQKDDKGCFDNFFRRFCCCFPCLQESSLAKKQLVVAGVVILLIVLVATVAALTRPESSSPSETSAAPSSMMQVVTPAPSLSLRPSPAPVIPVTVPPQCVTVPNPLDVSVGEFRNDTTYEIVYSGFLYEQHGWALTVPKGVTVAHTPSDDLRDESSRYVFIEDNPTRVMAQWHITYSDGCNAWRITVADQQSQYFGWHLLAAHEMDTDTRDRNSNYLFISKTARDDVPFPWQIQVLASDGNDDSDNSGLYRLWSLNPRRGLITDRAHRRDLRSNHSTYSSVHENTSYAWFIRPL